MKKRLLALSIAALMIISNAATVAGASDLSSTADLRVTKYSVEPYASAYLDDYSISFGARDDCRMVITMDVNAVRTMDRIGCTKLVIEKKVDGTWLLDDVLVSADYPEFYAYNTASYFHSIDYYGVAGYQYRVTMTAYAGRDGGYDTGEITSYVVTCRE